MSKRNKRLEVLEEVLTPKPYIVFCPMLDGTDNTKMIVNNDIVEVLNPGQHKAKVKELELEGVEFLDIVVNFL